MTTTDPRAVGHRFQAFDHELLGARCFTIVEAHDDHYEVRADGDPEGFHHVVPADDLLTIPVSVVYKSTRSGIGPVPEEHPHAWCSRTPYVAPKASEREHTCPIVCCLDCGTYWGPSGFFNPETGTGWERKDGPAAHAEETGHDVVFAPAGTVPSTLRGQALVTAR